MTVNILTKNTKSTNSQSNPSRRAGTLFLLLGTLAFMSKAKNVQPSLISEVLDKANAEHKKGQRIDVTNEVQRYIPIGTSSITAKNVLKENGLHITTHQTNGETLILGKMEFGRWLLGFREVRISLKIVNEKVDRVVGHVFYHTI